MNIDQLLNRHSDTYRFHGVRSATLARLVGQSEDGSIHLWGTDHDEHVDNEDNEYECQYVQGAGYLYTTMFNDIEMSYNEFCDEGGIVFVLEPVVPAPFETCVSSDERQCIIKDEEWCVIGGLRPIIDEDGDVIDQEALSLEEIFEV